MWTHSWREELKRPLDLSENCQSSVTENTTPLLLNGGIPIKIPILIDFGIFLIDFIGNNNILYGDWARIIQHNLKYMFWTSMSIFSQSKAYYWTSMSIISQSKSYYWTSVSSGCLNLYFWVLEFILWVSELILWVYRGPAGGRRRRWRRRGDGAPILIGVGLCFLSAICFGLWVQSTNHSSLR